MKSDHAVLIRFLAILVFGIALPSYGQVTTGTPPFGTFGGGPDVINLANLNSHIVVPIISRTGRNTSFSYTMSYDSSVWYPTTVNGTMTWQPVYNWGWRGQTEVGTGYVSGSQSTYTCYYTVGRIQYIGYIRTSTTNYMYHDPWGVPHPFSGTSNYYLGSGGGSCYPGTDNGVTATTTDGSGYKLNATDLGSSTVTARDGMIFTPPFASGAGAAGQSDTNGNNITVNSSGQFFDTLSSTTPALAVAGTAPNPTTFTYTAPNGTNVSYTMKYTNYTVQTSFGCSGVTEYSATNVPLVTEIDLPNGTKYTYTYEATPGHSGDVTGRLASVALTTGGTISYAYSGGSNGITCADGSSATLGRTTPDGTWTYAHTENGSTWTTTQTAPQMPYDSAANQTVYTFNSSGEITSKKTYQGSSTSGTLLRTVNTTWASNSTPATQITILEDNSTQSELETTYDNYGDLQVLKEHDYGSGAPGSVLRTTNYSYLSTSAYTNLSILNRVTEKTVADSTGTIQYREDYSYDGTTINPCPTGVPQHNDTNYGCSFTTRGNRTSFTTYTNAAAPSGAITKNSYYDFFGNLVQQDVDCCQSDTWSRSSTTSYAYPDSVTSGASGGPQTTLSYTYNTYTGQVATVTDPNNQTWSYAYDVMLRNTSVTRPDSAQITHSYNDSQNIVTNTVPVQNTNVQQKVEFEDTLGRIDKTVIEDGGGTSYSVLQKVFDPLGRFYERANPYTSTAQYWTTDQYDALGRRTKRILQDNSTEMNSYSLNAVTTTDAAGHQRKVQNDALGRTTTIYEPDPTNNNSLTLQTTFTYSVLNRPLTVTQGAQTRTYSYDGAGRLTGETSPEAGTVSYQYNNFDKLTQRTDARGVITTYGYDTLNRRSGISYNVGSTGVPATPSVSYSYGTSVSQYNNGRLLTVTDGVGTETYSYDQLGRVTQDQHVINSNSYTVSYQYNLAGSVTSTTYPSGRVVQESYDTVGRPSSLSSGTTTFASGLSFDPNIRLTGYTYGNGIAAAIGFSPDRLQYQSVGYTKSGQTLFGISTYGYTQNGGNNGEITSITDSVDSGRSATYTYDALDRVTSAVTSGSANYPKWGLSWTYDRYGNRTAQTVTAGTAPSNSVSVSATTNHITTSGYTYDANGNITNDGQNVITYDAENRVVSAADGSGTATYAYRSSGRRATKLFGGTTTTYIFSRDNVIAEYSNGTLSEEYTNLGQVMLASYDSGTLHYHHHDYLSVRMTTDTNGNEIGQQGHYPFGEDWYMTNTTVERHFTTYERDAESSNDYAINRYYVNRLGRFSTPDPVKGCRLKPQQFDRYSYVGNEPIGRTDPKGLYYMGGCDPVYGCGGQCVNVDGNCPAAPGEGCSDPMGGCDCASYLPIGCLPVIPPGVGSGGGGGGGSQICECEIMAMTLRAFGCAYTCVCFNPTDAAFFGFICKLNDKKALHLCPPDVILIDDQPTYPSNEAGLCN